MKSWLSYLAAGGLALGAAASAIGSAATAGAVTLAAPSAAPVPVLGHISLGLGLSESLRSGISVPVQNPNSSPLQILAVQTTGDLFVESFPATIPPLGTGNVMVIYSATALSSGSTDMVRLLTATGEMDVQVNHGRQPAVSLSASSLSWSIGESGAKSVTLTIAGGAAVPTVAHVYGSGNSATLVPNGGGSYLVNITPGSTAQAEQFPVIVDLSPALPGVVVAIACSVGIKAGP